MIVAVVATRNRRELLAECLTGVLDQTAQPDAIVVVDGCSGDGTAAMVRTEFPDVTLLELPEDRGPAGAFTAGIALALKLGAAWIWLLDDDALPEATALEALENAADGATLVTSRVVWTDGRDHPMNTPRVKPWASAAELALAARAGCLPIRSASFVSVLVDAQAVRDRGLPVADYFDKNEDFEFTTRLLRGHIGLLCRDSVVTHQTEIFGATDPEPGETFFYEVRNKVWQFTRSSGLGPLERLLYAGATARRWLRIYLRSRDRGTLRVTFMRGLRAGLRTRPRRNEEIFQAL
ncbi:glycosyltransferase [Actinocorallia longicatena]|uniref:Glycosyltransferase n=1 Tax=Actinocorallia longicatena TaxID=111803 RepID=A0ABP6QL03_9ACTN